MEKVTENKWDDSNRLIILETPFAGDIKKNIAFARACMKDCFCRCEFPFASHLLYTQEGILDDNSKEDRELGMKAGLAWGKYAVATVVYTDLGISEGMKRGIEQAQKDGRVVEYRKLKIIP
jgi:hypothetical protein